MTMSLLPVRRQRWERLLLLILLIIRVKGWFRTIRMLKEAKHAISTRMVDTGTRALALPVFPDYFQVLGHRASQTALHVLASQPSRSAEPSGTMDLFSVLVSRRPPKGVGSVCSKLLKRSLSFWLFVRPKGHYVTF